ncbi:hypothetical protein LJC69_05485, partial [Bacteroidales bacterium OttesenSCG-928-K22]|nr:hypothetical protein [Bacteroidales bacterium OttesenSCG-928-K22]
NIDKIAINGNITTDYVYDNSVITITSNNLTLGSNEIHIWYHGHPFSESWGGVVFNGEYVYNLGVGISTIPHNLGKAWFPCVDNFIDKATFDYYITVPEDKHATAGGLFQEIVSNNNNTKTFHYKTEIELPTYLASFAIGDYVVVEDSHQALNGEIPITYTLKPDQVNAAEVLFQNIHEIINIFEDKFGPYMFERIGYTATSIGAMEHQNNISFPNSCITANLNYESLYAHELFHSWFGNLITCASAKDMWINEGWATFGEYYFEEELYGKDRYISNILSAKNQVFRNAHKPSQDGDYYPLNQIPETNTYGVSAYQRGAIVVHSLRNYLGDELFFSSVKNMLANNAYSSMSSENLCEALSNTSGVDLNDFFHNFVYQGGAVCYIIDSCITNNNGNNTWDIEIYIQQKLSNRNEISNGNKVEITFMNSLLNSETILVEFDGQYGYANSTINIEPEMLFVNYYDKIYDAKFNAERILKTAGNQTFNYTNFGSYIENPITDSAYLHVAHYFVAPNEPLKVNGNYRLSNKHFWKINLIKYCDVDITGLFQYSKSDQDSDLIINNNDTVFLMYRINHSEAWNVLNATRYGNISSGNLWFNDLKSGEYTLAVIDSTINSISSNYNDNILLNVYPNPSKSSFNIVFEQDINNQHLIVYDSLGRKIKNFILNKESSIINWTPKTNTKNQTFVFVLQKKNGRNISQKAMLIK